LKVLIGNYHKPNEAPAGRRFPVDRRTPLGNPFFMATEADRDRACYMYQRWFEGSVLPAEKYANRFPQDPLVRAWKYLNEIARAAEHETVVLMCWCAPARCHAETIAKWVEEKLEEWKKSDLAKGREV